MVVILLVVVMGSAFWGMAQTYNPKDGYRCDKAYRDAFRKYPTKD